MKQIEEIRTRNTLTETLKSKIIKGEGGTEESFDVEFAAQEVKLSKAVRRLEEELKNWIERAPTVYKEMFSFSRQHQTKPLFYTTC